MSSICSFGSSSCTPGSLFRTVVVLGAVGAVAVGVISLLAHYHVLSAPWALLKDKAWSHICWGAGVSAGLVLSVYMYYNNTHNKVQSQRQQPLPPPVTPPARVRVLAPVSAAVARLSPYAQFQLDMQGSVLGTLASMVVPQQVAQFIKYEDGSFVLRYEKAMQGQLEYAGHKITLLFEATIRGKITTEKQGSIEKHTLTLEPAKAKVGEGWTSISATLVKVEHTMGNAKEPRNITIFAKKGLPLKHKDKAEDLQRHLQQHKIIFK